jgi:membrane-bound ClpP family serine protease
MAKKRDFAGLKAWLLALASLIDDVVLLVLLFVILRLFHIEITWPVILFVLLAVVAFFFIIHKAIVPGLRRRKVTGAEGMIGLTGSVAESLAPDGTVKISDEYWKAKSLEGKINTGEEVEVVGISGLELEVRRKR